MTMSHCPGRPSRYNYHRVQHGDQFRQYESDDKQQKRDQEPLVCYSKMLVNYRSPENVYKSRSPADK